MLSLFWRFWWNSRDSGEIPEILMRFQRFQLSKWHEIPKVIHPTVSRRNIPRIFWGWNLRNSWNTRSWKENGVSDPRLTSFIYKKSFIRALLLLLHRALLKIPKNRELIRKNHSLKQAVPRTTKIYLSSPWYRVSPLSKNGIKFSH